MKVISKRDTSFIITILTYTFATHTCTGLFEYIDDMFTNLRHVFVLLVVGRRYQKMNSYIFYQIHIVPIRNDFEISTVKKLKKRHCLQFFFICMCTFPWRQKFSEQIISSVTNSC